MNSDSSGPFWTFAAAQICDGKPGGDTQVQDIFKYLLFFPNKFWFCLICPSCTLSGFQVSDWKVPCFNRRSRQCELDFIMFSPLNLPKFVSKILHQIFDSEVANGGNRHFPFRTHTQSIRLGVCGCLGKDFIFAYVRGISKSAYALGTFLSFLSFHLPHLILSQVCESIETKACFSHCCFTNK